MPDSLNSPISAAGTEEGHLSESQSPPAAQRPRSFLSPGFENEEVQRQSNTVAQNAEMIEWRRSFIDVNSTTSEVSENTAQNGQSISEISPISPIVDELDNTDSHVISRALLEIDTLEAEVSQGYRSFLMPLNSSISVAGLSESHTTIIGS